MTPPTVPATNATVITHRFFNEKKLRILFYMLRKNIRQTWSTSHLQQLVAMTQPSTSPADSRRSQHECTPQSVRGSMTNGRPQKKLFLYYQHIFIVLFVSIFCVMLQVARTAAVFRFLSFRIIHCLKKNTVHITVIFSNNVLSRDIKK